jgi:hypothetical protein
VPTIKKLCIFKHATVKSQANHFATTAIGLGICFLPPLFFFIADGWL